MKFLDRKFACLSRLHGHAEAVMCCRSFFRFISCHQFPPIAHRMLNDHLPRGCVGVADRVSDLVTLLSGDEDHSLCYPYVAHRLVLEIRLGGDLDGSISSVREQAALVGMDGFNQTFSGKGSAINDVESAGI